MNKANLLIRNAESNDSDAIWQILQPIIEQGDAFVYAPDAKKKDVM